MWVVFRKSDGKVIAATAQAPGKKETALAEVVRGLVGSPSIEGFDAVEVEDTGVALGLRPGNQRQELSVRAGTGGKMAVVDATPEAAFVQITTNARDFHPVDNVPLIPGDGTSFLVVTLQKVGEQGKQLATSAKDNNDVIWLRPSHGTLREDRDPDPREIRSVTLVGGIGRFRFYSERAKRLATVQMLPENPHIQAGSLQVELT